MIEMGPRDGPAFSVTHTPKARGYSWLLRPLRAGYRLTFPDDNRFDYTRRHPHFWLNPDSTYRPNMEGWVAALQNSLLGYSL